MKQISDFTNVFTAIPCYLAYIWAVNYFCKKYLLISRVREKVFVIFLFSGWLFINIINEGYSVPYIVFSLFHHAFFISLVLLLFEADIEKKVLVSSVLIAVTTLVGNFCESFFSCVGLLLLHTVKNIPEPFFNRWEACLLVYIRFAIVMVAIYYMSKPVLSIFHSKMKKSYVILAVPLLAITAVIDIVNWGASNGVMVLSRENKGLFYDQLFSHAEICVLTALSIFATGFYVFGMDKIYLEQRKSVRYHSQLAVYKMLEEQDSQAERLRHDMKNHIIALSGLLESKEWEKMDEYLRSMKDSGDLGACEEVTGNRVVDALLYQKRKIAERKNIIWECDVQMPKTCGISEFDLCVLFGNLLDNAIEVCERLQDDKAVQPFITIQARAIKKCFLLEVKNSANMTDKQGTGFTNQKTKGQGIGLLNISDMVHQYNGAMNIEAENGIFVISILVPLNHATHDIKQTI